MRPTLVFFHNGSVGHQRSDGFWRSTRVIRAGHALPEFGVLDRHRGELVVAQRKTTRKTSKRRTVSKSMKKAAIPRRARSSGVKRSKSEKSSSVGSEEVTIDRRRSGRREENSPDCCQTIVTRTAAGTPPESESPTPDRPHHLRARLHRPGSRVHECARRLQAEERSDVSHVQRSARSDSRAGLHQAFGRRIDGDATGDQLVGRVRQAHAGRLVVRRPNRWNHWRMSCQCRCCNRRRPRRINSNAAS